jgi:hypothetical protein
MPKKTLAQRKALPNNKYWKKKCIDLFMAIGRGEPCAVCGKMEGTVFHHIIPQGRSKHLQFDFMNVIPLCHLHHAMGNEMAAHSTNGFAVQKFIEWLEREHPEKVKYCKENERVKAFWTYKDKYHEMFMNMC